jgi:hypothetical protein
MMIAEPGAHLVTNNYKKLKFVINMLLKAKAAMLIAKQLTHRLTM